MRHRQRHVGFGIAAVVLCATAIGARQIAPGESASRAWRRLTTEAFTVMAEGSEAQVRDVADKLEVFRAAVKGVFPNARLEPLVPTTVVVFDSQENLTPFKPRSGGRRQTWVAGYALSGGDVTLLVMGRGGDPSSTYGIVFHEYMHEILHRTFPAMPHWYNEGVAELFGAFAGTTSDARAVIGRPISHHIAAVRADRPLPLRDMLATPTAAKWQRELTARFYASAWLMAHYFLMDSGRRQGLLALLAELNAGADVDTAVQKAFGIDVDALSADLTNYAFRSQLPVVAPPVVPVRASSVEVARMTEREVTRMQADLLVRLGDYDAADRMLRKAVESAPGDDAFKTLTARLRVAQGRADDALTVLSAASEPRGPESLRAEGRALEVVGRLPEAADRLARAAAMGPPTPALLFDLGRVQMARAAWPEATAAFARLRALDPRASWDLSRAYDAYRLGYGTYAAAAARAYLSKVGWSEPSSAYAAFAGVLGLRRDARVEEGDLFLADLTRAATGTKWPVPVVAYLNRRLSASGLIDAADTDGERTEAHAYVGLVASIEGRRDEAREHLMWVKDRGEKQYIEYRWAVAELERLDRPPIP